MDVAEDVKMYPELDYFMNEEKSDVVFVIDGHRVPALKQLLSVKSDVFRAMLSGNWKESNGNEIQIECTTFEAFKSMIKFFYTGHVVLVDEHQVDFIQDMLILAEKYQLTRFADKISHQIKEILSLDNFDNFCKMAYDLDAKQVIPVLKNYMKINFDTFTRMDFKRLKTIDGWTDQSWLEVVMVQHFSTSVAECNQSIIRDFSKYPEFEYFMNEDVSDVVFIVEGKRFPAIKQLLALKSIIFRSMFDKNEDVNEITLEETSCEAFKELIHFIYTDNMPVDKWSINLLSSSELACKYQVYRFVELISKIMVITPDNFELIAQSAYNITRSQYKSTLLLKKLREFMDNNFKQHFYGKNIIYLKRINSWTDQSLFEIIFSRLKKAQEFFRRHSFARCTLYCQKLVTCCFSNVIDKLNGGVPVNEQIELTSENFDEKCQLAYKTKSESLMNNLKFFIDNNFKEFFAKDIGHLKKINEWTDENLFVIWIQRLRTAENYYTRTHANHEQHNRPYRRIHELEHFI